MIHWSIMTEYPDSHNFSLRQKLPLLAQKYELNQLEISPLRSALTIDFYERWLAQRYHGDMSYLQTHLPLKKEPQKAHPLMRSVISVAQPYYPAAKKSAALPAARIALYAHQDDYHYWLKNKLEQIIDELRTDFPDALFAPYVDSGPLLERELGYQNSLGWFGKNTCLIHPEKGSLFFLAEILTSIDTSQEPPLSPLPDFCGKCTRCIDICPTGALESPKSLKADQCISYYTIESKTIPPESMRKKIGDWFFGCDLCQTVCPWNEKFFRSLSHVLPAEISTTSLLNLDSAQETALVSYFRFLLTASHKQIQRHHQGSPLSRAGAKGLKRNALIVIGNRRLHALKDEVKKLVSVEGFQELALWTMKELS